VYNYWVFRMKQNRLSWNIECFHDQRKKIKWYNNMQMLGHKHKPPIWKLA